MPFTLVVLNTALPLFKSNFVVVSFPEDEVDVDILNPSTVASISVAFVMAFSASPSAATILASNPSTVCDNVE